MQRLEKRAIKTAVVKEFSEPEKGDAVIMGGYSRAWLNRPYREVLEQKALTYYGYIESPTTLARDYLMLCFKPSKIKTEQKAVLFGARMPTYSKPSIFKDGIYIDIKSAWWSILNLVGWDVDFNPGKWFGFGSPADDFPFFDSKVARSALVSIGRMSKMYVMVDGVTQIRQTGNPLLNYNLYGAIAATLNTFATRAINDYGCVYVNTDGFIFPDVDRGREFENYLLRFGLASGIKGTGAGFVASVGSYRVGDMLSARLTRCRHSAGLWQIAEPEWIEKRLENVFKIRGLQFL